MSDEELDFSIPVMIEGGHPVEIVTTTMPNTDYPVLGYVLFDDETLAGQWDRFGVNRDPEGSILYQVEVLRTITLYKSSVVEGEWEGGIANITVDHKMKEIFIISGDYSVVPCSKMGVPETAPVKLTPLQSPEEDGVVQTTGKRDLKIKKEEPPTGGLMAAFTRGGGIEQFLRD